MATSEPRNIADIGPPSDLPNHADFVIIGGGIIGLAVARQLLLGDKGLSVVVLEKENAIATHQTGHSSGVVHAGIYYRPGSQKAELTRRSVGMLREYVETHGLPYIECGKLVIAASESEVPLLRELEHRATANGVPGLEVVDRAGIERREPAAVGHQAIWSPTTAITDFVAVAERIALDVTTAGGMVISDAEVLNIAQSATKVEVVVGPERRLITAGVAVVCAGVQSDRLAVLAGDSAEPAVVPFRGEYLRLAAAKTELVRGLIYPVPDPNYPFLGVHLTRTVHGDVLVGPNAVLAFARDGYRWRDVEISHLRDLASTAGFRHLAADHWRRGVVESWRSVNKRAYVRDVQRYVPGVAASDLVRARAGVRAQAVDRSGKLIDDFLVGQKGRVVTVRNAPSPGATAALALAEDIAAKAAAAL